jgi:organic hydroperoxide reductase OsmC/OhrA
MSEHRATVEWQRSGEFRYEAYSRSHKIVFPNGIFLDGAAAPENIPASARGAAGVDPEQAFVAALSSCHMLWFLHLACQKKWAVERYLDEAVGILEGSWIARVTLRPAVSFAGPAPSEAEHRALHERAPEKCFVANSVKTEVRIEPRLA